MNNIIRKITIENFRSIKKQTIECTNLNVFSGLNDVGKSNVLKALNLFFNSKTDFQTPLKFEIDFNKIALAEAQGASKKKQQIKIKVYFNVPDGFNSIKTEGEVWVEKVFDRFNNMSQTYSTLESKKIAVITRLYNKIKFVYVPALKSGDVLQGLFSELGGFNLISQDDIMRLNESINDQITGLNEILKESKLPLDSSFRLPVFLQDFLKTLVVQTTLDSFTELQKETVDSSKGKLISLNTELYQIPLAVRGEGIRSKFIPALLKWLQKLNPSSVYVWGIDEPENSLEFKKAQELADLFYNYYSIETQILITSHSLSFIFPDEINSNITHTIFRCRKENFGQTSIVALKDFLEKVDKIELSEEMGVLEIQKEVIELYRTKTTELNSIKEKLKNITKPLIFCEGETDKKFIELAYSMLRPTISECPFEIFEVDSNPKNNGTSIGAGAGKLNDFLINHASKIHNSRKIIGIFDYDKTGFNEFRGITKSIFKIKEETDHIKMAIHHKNQDIIAFLLPVPTHRNTFTDKNNAEYCKFSIELYLEDDIVLETYREYPSRNDKSIFSFKGNKNNFFEQVRKKKEDINFAHFELLLQKIESLI